MVFLTLFTFESKGSSVVDPSTIYYLLIIYNIIMLCFMLYLTFPALLLRIYIFTLQITSSKESEPRVFPSIENINSRRHSLLFGSCWNVGDDHVAIFEDFGPNGREAFITVGGEYGCFVGLQIRVSGHFDSSLGKARQAGRR